MFQGFIPQVLNHIREFFDFNIPPESVTVNFDGEIIWKKPVNGANFPEFYLYVGNYLREHLSPNTKINVIMDDTCSHITIFTPIARPIFKDVANAQNAAMFNDKTLYYLPPVIRGLFDFFKQVDQRGFSQFRKYVASAHAKVAYLSALIELGRAGRIWPQPSRSYMWFYKKKPSVLKKGGCSRDRKMGFVWF